jgi:ribosomal protein L11 methyltransferase
MKITSKLRLFFYDSVMSKYIRLNFAGISPEQSDILVAELSEEGFEGFEEEVNSLKAFISIDNWKEDEIREIAERAGVGYSKEIIEETNWNQVWESNFQPVKVEDYVSVRAHFHEPVEGVKHEIIITPKMSFGTGHHATTYMMIQFMEGIPMSGKSLLDFGTGTGVLAILACKTGATPIIAIDNDDWCIANARENILQNNCASIILKKAETARLNLVFDIILANINKNVILDNFPSLTKQLAPDGVLVLSGILTSDEPEILAKAKEQGLTLTQRLAKDNWLALRLSR